MLLILNDRTATERENTENYKDLRFEIKRQWNIKADVIPIVIWEVGNIKAELENYMNKYRIVPLIKAAPLLGLRDHSSQPTN